MMPLVNNSSNNNKARVGFSKDGYSSPTSRNGTASPFRSDGTSPAMNGTMFGDFGSKKHSSQSMAEDTDQVKFLREWYSIARAKHEEYKTNPDIALLSRNYDDKAARLYYVLHTLLYTSICAVKANTLDKYLRTKGQTFAKSVFDISEWDPVLRIAKECRTLELQAEKKELVAVHSAEQNDLFTRLGDIRNVGLTCKTDINQFKSTVVLDLDDLRGMISTLQVQIGQVVSSFAGKQDELMSSYRREIDEEKQKRMELQSRNGLLEHQNELLESQLKSMSLITKERDTTRLQLTATTMDDGIVESLVIPGNQSTYDNAELRQSMEILSSSYDLSKLELKDLNFRMEQLMKEKHELDALVVNLQSQLRSAHERESTHTSELEALNVDIDRLTTKVEVLTSAATTPSPPTNTTFNNNNNNSSINSSNSDVNLETSSKHAELLALMALVEDMKRETDEIRRIHSTELAAATARTNDLLVERESLQALLHQAQDLQLVQENELKGRLAEVVRQLTDMQGKNTDLVQAVERAQQALRDQIANGTDASKVVDSLQQEQIIAASQFETQLQALRSRNLLLEEELSALNTRTKASDRQMATADAAAELSRTTEQDMILALRQELAENVAELNQMKLHVQTASDSLQVQLTNVDLLAKENRQLHEQQVDTQQIHDKTLEKQQLETATFVAEIEKFQQQLAAQTQQHQQNIAQQTEATSNNNELQRQVADLQYQLEQERTQQQLQLATSLEPALSTSVKEPESQTIRQLELAAIQLRDSLTIIGKLKTETEESKVTIEQLQNEIDQLKMDRGSGKVKVSFEEQLRRESLSPLVKSMLVASGNVPEDPAGKRKQAVTGASYLPKQGYEVDESIGGESEKMPRNLSLEVPDGGHLVIPEGFALSPDNRAGGGASPSHFDSTTMASVMDPETPMELKKDKSALLPVTVKAEKLTSVKNMFTIQASNNSIGSANSAAGGGIAKAIRFPPASGTSTPPEFPKRSQVIVSSVMMQSKKSEEIEDPGVDSEAQLPESSGEGEFYDVDARKDKIWEAHLSGWRTVCANLRKKADHDRQELKSCQLKLKSTKSMLRSAMEGDFTNSSLGAKVLQHATKNRLQTFEDMTAFINKADETTLNEQILTTTVSDLTMELKAQKHGESFGLWKQIEVLKEEREFLTRKNKELEDVSKEFMALKVEHRDLQHMMYETSQRLIRSKQEIAVLKRSKAVPLRAVITMEQLRSASPDHNMNAIVETAASNGTLHFTTSQKSEIGLLSSSTKTDDHPTGRLSPSDNAGGGAAPVELPMVTPLGRKSTMKIPSQSYTSQKSFRFEPVSRNESTMVDNEEGLDGMMMTNFGGMSNPKFMQELAIAAKRKRMAEELRGVDSLKSMYKAGSSHSVEMSAFEKEEKEKRTAMKAFRKERRKSSVNR